MDEFDKMPGEHQSLLEAMEQQEVGGEGFGGPHPQPQLCICTYSIRTYSRAYAHACHAAMCGAGL